MHPEVSEPIPKSSRIEHSISLCIVLFQESQPDGNNLSDQGYIYLMCFRDCLNT